MKRVGYDSDSGRYYFRDREGVLYEGGEGAEFGEMTRGVFPPLLLAIFFILFIILTFRSIWSTSCDT